MRVDNVAWVQLYADGFEQLPMPRSCSSGTSTKRPWPRDIYTTIATR